MADNVMIRAYQDITYHQERFLDNHVHYSIQNEVNYICMLADQIMMSYYITTQFELRNNITGLKQDANF